MIEPTVRNALTSKFISLLYVNSKGSDSRLEAFSALATGLKEFMGDRGSSAERIHLDDFVSALGDVLDSVNRTERVRWKRLTKDGLKVGQLVRFSLLGLNDDGVIRKDYEGTIFIIDHKHNLLCILLKDKTRKDLILDKLPLSFEVMQIV